MDKIKERSSSCCGDNTFPYHEIMKKSMEVELREKFTDTLLTTPILHTRNKRNWKS